MMRVSEQDGMKAAIEAAIKTAPGDDHYQAAMAMSEKHRKLWVEASQEAKRVREALQGFMKIGARPWLDGGVSWPEWDAAMTAAEAALKPGDR